jgi:hypothetical protein
VTDPETSQPFTEDAAWAYIERALKDGAELEEVILRKPPGKTGFVLHLPGVQSRIYVKLQLASREVIGRSFHVCDR